jgi:hypothetical protein
MHNQIINILKKYTKHENIELTSRGNTAIFASLYIARKINQKKKTVLIPDQGGWLTYKKYPKMLELNLIELKTNKGLIEPEVLKQTLKDYDVNCLLYENPAGYFADQNIKEIYEICKDKCSVILDASGCISNPDMCNGDYADFIIGSFGKWKPVWVEYGGFVSIKNKDHYLFANEIFNTTAFDEKYYKELLTKLKEVPKRLEKLNKISKQIKLDLKDKKIIHQNKDGICVVIAFENNNEKQEIIDYCEKHKYEYTSCPRYIRIMQDAISIEVKRLR